MFIIKFNSKTGLGCVLLTDVIFVDSEPLKNYPNVYYEDLTAEEIGQIIG